MKINGEAYRTIWLNDDGWRVNIIDQTLLPFELKIAALASVEEAARAIKTMQVRGAPLIGMTAAYGLCLALRADSSTPALQNAVELLTSQRATAVNCHWALVQMARSLLPLPESERAAAAYKRAGELCDMDVETCRKIGDYGAELIKQKAAQKNGGVVNILTHCNAGWLATVDWGTALAPIYMAHDAGVKLHIWVDETRPRNQGAALTAYELAQHGVPHSLIVDNTGGHLMQHGMVDICIIGTDRTAANGDVGNKIGTYLKALAAKDNDIPFYVALPESTIDWTLSAGRDMPIEQRESTEVTHIYGQAASGEVVQVRLVGEGSAAVNYAFDVTPARLVTGLITNRGVCQATREGLAALFPDLV